MARFFFIRYRLPDGVRTKADVRLTIETACEQRVLVRTPSQEDDDEPLQVLIPVEAPAGARFGATVTVEFANDERSLRLPGKDGAGAGDPCPNGAGGTNSGGAGGT